MEGQTIRTGGCGCGKVRYRILREAIFINNCYCALCQLQTGGTCSAYAFYEIEAVEIVSGKLRRFDQHTGTDRTQKVMQCSECGIGLFFQPFPTGRHGIAVRLGTMDDPFDLVPDAAIFVSERMPWVQLPEGIPAFDGYYKPSELLPPERYARLTALLEMHRQDKTLEV